tara:strand:- start:182 stop:589 length:408 start_codon:yes stop_codon:yes gene_type:complete
MELLNKSHLKVLVLSIIFFLVLDALFIGALMKDWQSLLLRVQGEKMEVRLSSAVGAYVVMVLAWVYFVYRPYLVHKNISTAVRTGAMLGFVIYGVFELTNFAIIKKWNMKFVLMDTIWGSLLYGLVTYFSLSLMR